MPIETNNNIRTVQFKSLQRSPVMGDFYGTGIEIRDGFGPVGIIEKKNIWADYEQLLSFCGQKN